MKRGHKRQNSAPQSALQSLVHSTSEIIEDQGSGIGPSLLITPDEGKSSAKLSMKSKSLAMNTSFSRPPLSPSVGRLPKDGSKVDAEQAFIIAFYSLFDTSSSESKIEAFCLTYTTILPEGVSLPKLLINALSSVTLGSPNSHVKILYLSTLLKFSTRHYLIHYSRPQITQILNVMMTIPFRPYLNSYKLALLSYFKRAKNRIEPPNYNPNDHFDLLQPPQSPKSPKSNALMNGTWQRFRDIDVREWAREVTFMEAYKLNQITVKELILYSTNPKSVNSGNNNLAWMIEWFNSVSKWVTTTILTADSTSISQKIQKFILLVRHLERLNNYNTLMEVLTGLKAHAVERLKKGWIELSDDTKSYFAETSEIMTPSHAYQNYRRMLTSKISLQLGEGNNTENGSTGSNSGSSNSNNNNNNSNNNSNTVPGLIPYIGVIMRDLTISMEGNKKYSEDGTVNWATLEVLGGVLKQFLKYQYLSQKYIFTKDTISRFHFTREISTRICPRIPGVVYDDDRIWALSTNIQPLTNNSLPSTPSMDQTNSDDSAEASPSAYSSSSPIKTNFAVKPRGRRTPDLRASGKDEPNPAHLRGDINKSMSKLVSGSDRETRTSSTSMEGTTSNSNDQEVSSDDLSTSQTFMDGEQSEEDENKVDMDESMMSQSPEEWGVDQVIVWLEVIDMSEYSSLFESQEMIGEDLFDLTNEDLIAMGIAKKGHRKKLLMRIAILKVVAATKYL
eukprot:TRINITY_DN74_c8_g1_i1.p1 TRINITY_DN74_c8_g1~~TRINITY_DN74_c8_g1_i1.p1  ORF type:complete len:731 (-),score=130.34 TRINITY_DN74_c8_g1_i1:81-2273(-)